MKPHSHHGTNRLWLARSATLALLQIALASGTAAESEKISDSALQQIRALQQEKASRPPQHRKLDSQFVFKLKQQRGQAIAQGVSALRTDVNVETNGRVLVDISATVTPALLSQIQQAGGTIVNSFPRFRAIRALVVLDQLEVLAAVPEVTFIRPAAKAHTNAGALISEGDATHRADFARTQFGADGHGVKVGVLSDGISYLQYSQANEELGAVTILPGQEGGGAEGTAMLEIIHDLAPGAQLYFATAFNGEASFAENILNLRSNGCDIIVDDVYYFNESPFQDGIIAQAVNSVTADGALYFSSAGNDGNLPDRTSGTWEGDFVDGGPALPPVSLGGGTIHRFGNATYNTLLQPGYGVDLFWADPLGASTNDYDLFLLDSTGSYVVATSLNLQDGTQDPYEYVPYAYQNERIVVVKASGAARFMRVSSSRGRLSVNTGSAIKGHAAAAAAFAVAAVDAATSAPQPFAGGSQNPAEQYSSDGPRRMFFNADGTAITPGNFSATGGILRQKPDLAAADGVATSVPGFYPFFGTSAAAPHAAAIAALLWSYDRGLSPSQIRNVLTGATLDIETPGFDTVAGAGIVMAFESLQSLPPRPVIVAGDSAVTVESCPNGVLDPGETVTVNLSLANLGAANTTNLLATLLAAGGMTPLGGPQSYGSLVAHGGTAAKPFNFLVAGDCGGTNTATLQLQDGTNNLGSVSFTFRLGQQRIPLAENFDSVAAPALPPGWTITTSGSGAPWRTTNVLSDTPPNSVFVPVLGLVSDKSLVSPTFAIKTASAQITFRHSVNMYYGYDGAVLEISTNGSPFADIITAGGTFVSNPYFTTLYTGYNNPLSGRLAWTGYSGGFITTVANLPAAAAGKNVRLRWRLGSGAGGGGEGWYVDSILVTDGFECCGTIPNDLVVRISDAPDPVTVGGTLAYTISIYNTGPAPAMGVAVNDVLPPNFTFQSVTFSQPNRPGPQANGGGTLNFPLGTLPGGEATTVTIAGTVDSAGLMTNRVTVSRTDVDANPTNNTATAVTTVSLPSLSIADVSVLEGNSGTTNVVFTVTMSPPPAQTATVGFTTATSNANAVAGSDFAGTNGTLVFAPGVTNRTIAVAVFGDTLNEADEIFFVHLFNPTNAMLGSADAVATIVNDDPLPGLSISDVTVTHAASGSTNAAFTVRLSKASGQQVTVGYFTTDGSAAAGSDYVPVNYTTLFFNPGQTAKTIAVSVKSHISAKPAQTFHVVLQNPYHVKLGRSEALGTIVTALPGQIDHLVWDPVASPQSNGAPFRVGITAEDYFGGLVSSFTGTVALSASALNGTRTNSIFGNITHSDFYNTGTYTIGNAFTPNTNLTVTHVRHYFGTKVSIWTDTGVLLASQNVSSLPGSWQETPLAMPVELSAGRTYRIGVYTAGNNYYGRFDQTSAFADGTINQTYWTYGDGFPVNFDNWRWIFVDIGYVIGAFAPVPVTPTNSGNFSNGLWSGSIIVQQPATNVTLRADDGFGHSGRSLPFAVMPVRGRVTHFTWNGISSPQSNGAPFAATITAQDYFNDTATNFTGSVSLFANGLVGFVTNTILGSPGYSDSSSGTYTFGYSFTPRTNITVTHVRHFFGTSVSIWNEAGVLLASRGVSSATGTWRETALITPVQLLAGQRYRVGVYTGGGNYYWRYDLPTTFPDGTIDQSYQSVGSSFPTNSDSVKWWFVDLRYTADVASPLSLSRTNAGSFVDGVWSGDLAVLQSAVKATVRADDGFGHAGKTAAFDVAPARGQVTHFGWSAISSPQTNGTPFPVTITALDYLNETVSNFTGAVSLSGTGLFGFITNRILGSPTHTEFSSGTYTFGYAFTPRTNITLTHVRHYFGTRVSIWNDAGGLLASRSVSSVAGTWKETALVTPLQLLAGQRYRVGVYTGDGNYYWRYDLPTDFPDGTIDQSYQGSGTAFPTTPDSVRWWFVDLRYSINISGPVTLNLGNSGNFTDGVWSGNIAVQEPVPKATLRAEDSYGHFGESLTFDLAGWPLVIAQPQSLARLVGDSATFSVTAIGSAPLAYQWLFNGTLPIPGATAATCTVTNIQLTNVGNYSCRITNLFGSATSSPALLTVGVPEGNVSVSFDSNPSNLLAYFGPAKWVASGGFTNSGYLALTDSLNYQRGAVVFNELLPGQNIRSFSLSADVRLGGGTSMPADGFSISLARTDDPVVFDGQSFLPAPDGSAPSAAEEGTRTGLSVLFDTYYNGGADLIGIGVRVDGQVIAQYSYPTLNGAANDTTSLQTGPLSDDSSNPTKFLSWVPLAISLNDDGTLEIRYKGTSVTPPGGLQTQFIPGPAQLVLGARTGGSYEVHHFDNIALAVNLTIPPAQITMRPVGDEFQLSWAAGILQSASRPEGPYTNVAGATSPYTVTPSAAQQFYRVKVQ